MKPLLSIVIPTFGRHDSLVRLLDCLREQTLQNIEVLVVDQNEPDFLKSNLSCLIREGVTWIHQEIPNASTARNVGFMQSSGKFVLFIDDDLEPTPDFCQRAVEVLQVHSEIKCLCPVVYAQDVDQAVTELRQHQIGPTIPSTRLVQIQQTISAAVFFERKGFEQSGGFDELLFSYARTAEDQELFLRMGRRGLSIWLDTDIRVFHNEDVAGGCELRTSQRFETRKRCVKSWALRYRIHRGKNGRLTMSDMVPLARSSFLNSGLWRHSPMQTTREMALLWFAVGDSKRYLQPHLRQYRRIDKIDHLAKYKSSSIP